MRDIVREELRHFMNKYFDKTGICNDITTTDPFLILVDSYDCLPRFHLLSLELLWTASPSMSHLFFDSTPLKTH
jgi:hypothetical protein